MTEIAPTAREVRATLENMMMIENVVRKNR